MSREINEIEDALEVLAKMKVAWATVNKIQNSMWDTGVAFVGSNHCRIAYYDEVQDVISITQQRKEVMETINTDRNINKN